MRVHTGDTAGTTPTASQSKLPHCAPTRHEASRELWAGTGRVMQEAGAGVGVGARGTRSWNGQAHFNSRRGARGHRVGSTSVFSETPEQYQEENPETLSRLHVSRKPQEQYICMSL